MRPKATARKVILVGFSDRGCPDQLGVARINPAVGLTLPDD